MAPVYGSWHEHEGGSLVGKTSCTFHIGKGAEPHSKLNEETSFHRSNTHFACVRAFMFSQTGRFRISFIAPFVGTLITLLGIRLEFPIDNHRHILRVRGGG